MPPAAFAVGDLVQVRAGTLPTHFRTPEYVQGKIGRVAALCGAFPNPETLAHGGDGQPPAWLYRIEFPQTALWGGYVGHPADILLVDIYEHWLEPPAA